MEDRTLTITTDSGEEILCEILFTTHSEEFNKDYVVFVEKGTNTASAAIYNANDKEWTMLEEMLDDYYNNQENGCGGSCESCSGCDETIED